MWSKITERNDERKSGHSMDDGKQDVTAKSEDDGLSSPTLTSSMERNKRGIFYSPKYTTQMTHGSQHLLHYFRIFPWLFLHNVIKAAILWPNDHFTGKLQGKGMAKAKMEMKHPGGAESYRKNLEDNNSHRSQGEEDNYWGPTLH